jgi:pyridoxamine 5'-phosphate oxidase
MTEWMQELSLLSEAEFHNRRIVATLATVDVNGNPRARTVFVRSMDPVANTIWTTTDARSAKVAQLQARPMAELCFWTPHERQQFRILGRIEIASEGALRDEIWQQMSGAARALFFWPAPGEPCKAGDEFIATVSAATPVPANFLLLALRPIEVESLELNDTPHRRRRWREANGWKVERINP